MDNNRVKVGIVGLGRWARVLARAARASDTLEIVAGYSRSEENRAAFEREFGIRAAPEMTALLADPQIEGVILTVPNEQHLPLAREVAAAGKHVYTEKPIASTLEEGLAIEALEKTHGISVTVGHSARLMAGIRMIAKAIEAGELGRVGFLEANFSNERALELTPKAWRWYRDRAPGGPLSQLAIHQFDVLHCLGGEIVEASSIASKLSPVGAEVDDQSMTVLRFADGKIGYVGSSWTSPGVFCVRVFGSKGPDALRDRLRNLGYAGETAPDVDAVYPARQGRLRQTAGAGGAAERHVQSRARHVRGELPHRTGRANSMLATRTSRSRWFTPGSNRSNGRARRCASPT